MIGGCGRCMMFSRSRRLSRRVVWSVGAANAGCSRTRGDGSKVMGLEVEVGGRTWT